MNIIARRIKISPVGNKEEVNRVYKYLRDSINAQNRQMNLEMSNLYVTNMLEATEEDRKELHKLYMRIPKSKKGSAYDESLPFQTGFPIGTAIKYVDSAFSKAKNDGLLKGKTSLPVYNKANPLRIDPKLCRLQSANKDKAGCSNTGLYHNYSSHTEFLDHLYKKDVEIFLQFVNKIVFKIDFGKVSKSYELRTIFQKIFEEEYDIGGSQIQLKQKDTGKGEDIFLLLTINTPQVEHNLDENIVVGVDLGQAVPATCAINTKWQPREYIGNGSVFIHHKEKLKNQRRQLNKNLALCSGGHGRKKKLRKMKIYSESESNFADSYCHKISKKVVDFAIKNNAKYINMEDLTGINKKDKILGDRWKYYKLQSDIKYKAEKHGIVVRKINPKYTSQKCSVCGCIDENNRHGRDFHCVKCGMKLHADYNAARNIAMSTEFIKEKEDKKGGKKKSKEAE